MARRARRAGRASTAQSHWLKQHAAADALVAPPLWPHRALLVAAALLSSLTFPLTIALLAAPWLRVLSLGLTTSTFNGAAAPAHLEAGLLALFAFTDCNPNGAARVAQPYMFSACGVTRPFLDSDATSAQVKGACAAAAAALLATLLLLLVLLTRNLRYCGQPRLSRLSRDDPLYVGFSLNSRLQLLAHGACVALALSVYFCVVGPSVESHLGPGSATPDAAFYIGLVHLFASLAAALSYSLYAHWATQYAALHPLPTALLPPLDPPQSTAREERSPVEQERLLQVLRECGSGGDVAGSGAGAGAGAGVRVGAAPGLMQAQAHAAAVVAAAHAGGSLTTEQIRIVLEEAARRGVAPVRPAVAVPASPAASLTYSTPEPYAAPLPYYPQPQALGLAGTPSYPGVTAGAASYAPPSATPTYAIYSTASDAPSRPPIVQWGAAAYPAALPR